MAGQSPQPLPILQVPRRFIRSVSLSNTVSRTEKYVTDRAQFDQTALQAGQQEMIANNGQQTGGIVRAVDLATRIHPYQYAAAIFPHVGDLPSQPSAVTMDGPISYGALPKGVNATYGYARWTGWLWVVTPGTYNFHITSTDGSNLFVKETQIVGSLTTSGAVDANGNIALLKGPVPICIEWQWGTDVPAIALKWTPPGGSEALIPTNFLSNSLNQVSGFLTGWWWNGSQAFWMP